jgi:hypothetical protein
MHPNLYYGSVVLVGMCILAPVHAQTTKPLGTPGMTMPPRPATALVASGNTVSLHEPKRLESAPQPPEALRQVAAELSGKLVGQSQNLSIEFALILRNNGPQEVKILDPLDTFSLLFTTTSDKPIPVPERAPKSLVKIGRPKGLSEDAIAAMRRDAPYPAAVRFRQIVRVNGPSSQKEQTIMIPPGASIQLVFESEPVVMERVLEALRRETGERAKSFRAEAFLALISDPPKAGGRTLYSDPILFTIPTP